MYLQDFKIDRESLAKACENMVKIVGEMPLTIVDHHLLRSLDYKEYLRPVHAEARRRGHRVLSASEFVGQEPKLLEARRKEFHAQEPVEKAWYERLKQGEFKEGF